MKYILTFVAVLALFSCENRNTENAGDSNSYAYKKPNDPFEDLDPESGQAGGSRPVDDNRPNEKWYGIDSDFDTVVYEQDGKILSSGYVTGTFERIDRNDFMHYVIRDSNDMLHSFFIYLNDQGQMDDYYEGYEPARGHPVTVKWIRGPLRVSDGGAMETVYQAKEIIE